MVNIGLALIAGGALGNLIDRLMLGHVVDFVQFCFNTVCGFPVFNIADSVIIIGTGLILFAWLTQKPPEPQPDSEMSVIEE
jgi:signal peptidase II